MSTPTPTHTPTLAAVQAKLLAAQNCHPNAVQHLIAEALDAIDAFARAPVAPLQGEQPRTLNDWFLSLPEDRQAVLRDDKWMLARAAFCAGMKAGQDSRTPTVAPGGQPLAQPNFSKEQS